MNSFSRLLLLLVVLEHSCWCYGQQGVPIIETQFSNYQKRMTGEKIFMHHDKSYYLAGEVLWFKLYYVDGDSHHPGEISKVAYMEILDSASKPVLQAKVLLQNGSGSGSLFIPVTIHSGVYTLRAYTQWMKNGSPDYFFEKPLTIINSLKSLDATSFQRNRYFINFFPEGGNLVENLQSKLAFKVADHAGRGIEFKGFIVNSNNDTVTTFQPFKFGMGHCLFTPSAGDQYKAIIQTNDTLITAALPSVMKHGYVMRVMNESASQIRVTVATNILSAKSVRLFAHTRQSAKFFEEKSINKGIAEFVISTSDLGEGISHLTVFTEANQPVCERLRFLRPAQRLVLQSDAAAAQFESRKKVSIGITSKDESGRVLPADLSVSVYKVDEALDLSVQHIQDYFWLQSDLKGNVEFPAFYFGNAPEVQEATDNLMLTHGWRRFIWQDILSKTSLPPAHVPELKSHIVHARVFNVRTGEPAANVLAYLSVPGKRVQMYSAKSDMAGNLKFYTTNLYGPNEILLQTDTRLDTLYRIELLNPFDERYSSRTLPPFDLPHSLRDPLLDQTVSVQVQNIFSGERIHQLYSPDIDSNGFYGPPDNSYQLDNYVRFTTMEEVLREYIVEVLVRRQKEDFRLVMSGGLDNRVFLDDPLTLFNGVPVFDVKKIMQYDPLKIQRVEVVKRRYFYGPATMNGIVNFISYQPDPEMISALNAIVFDYEGVLLDREFYSPAYETPEQQSSRMPDFRNVLFWSPNVTTDGQGRNTINFFTSDQKGKYTAIIQGTDKNGRFGAHSFNFTVK